MLNQLCDKLCSHGFSTNEIRLKLELDNRQEHVRTLSLPLPMRQPKAILKLLQLDLEAHPPQASIVAVNLLLQPVEPRTVQNGMFLPITPAPDKLEVTLTRIRALVGEENAGVPELLNTHRPAPFRLVNKQPTTQIKPAAEQPDHTPHLAFRYFNPPLKAKVDFSNHGPVRLSAGAIRGNILTFAGPWRSSGDWWTGNPWNRDEWDVSLHDGALYRLYRNPDGTWFIEGTYD
ncbi:MAG: hypothetical protein JO022_06380 [Acidobacteriaceae bacterium]|nr:hypothetical protein [Acidobacteriaceae bacterium]